MLLSSPKPFPRLPSTDIYNKYYDVVPNLVFPSSITETNGFSYKKPDNKKSIDGIGYTQRDQGVPTHQ